VDKARRDHGALGVEHPVGAAADVAQLRDAAAADAEITAPARTSGPVDQRAAPDQEIEVRAHDLVLVIAVTIRRLSRSVQPEACSSPYLLPSSAQASPASGSRALRAARLRRARSAKSRSASDNSRAPVSTPRCSASNAVRNAWTVSGCQNDAFSSVSAWKERVRMFAEPMVAQASSTSIIFAWT